MSDNSLLKIPDNVLGEIYRDAFSPSAKSFGIALNHIVSVLKLVTLPVGVLGPTTDVLYKKYQDFLTESFKKVPEDKRRPPDLNVASPIIQNVGNVFDKDDLKALYSNLLASASNTESHKDVHPAFPTIISQLDSIDAKIIKEIHQNSVLPYIEFGAISEKTGRMILPIEPPFTLLDGYENDAREIASSLLNLERLGLIQKVRACQEDTEYIYRKLYSTKKIDGHCNFNKQVKPDRFSLEKSLIDIIHGSYIATPFGIRFINSCIDD